MHTENYNGFPNKYVPERRVELRQIDPIRHCIIFHRISESDAGLYTVVATNPLGEAVCQANFVIEPGEGGAAGRCLTPGVHPRPILGQSLTCPIQILDPD